jgi:hypothetical protein
VRALADTSLFVALEQQRPLADTPPDELSISVMTLAELQLGVLRAHTPAIQSQRLRTLQAVRESIDALPVDEAVASRFADMAAELRAAGRRAPIVDLLIAATAIRHELPICTQDRDFDHYPDLRVLRI